jgi:hypothetical protein
MDAVDVLGRRDRLDHPGLVEMVGERKLDEQTVDPVVGVDLGDRRQQILLRRVGGQLEVTRIHPGLRRGLLLQVDVDVRRGVVANQHGGEADVAELGDRSGHLLAHLRAEGLAVDERRGHEARL